MAEEHSSLPTVPVTVHRRRWSRGRILLLVIVVVLLGSILVPVELRNYLRAQAAILNAANAPRLVKKWTAVMTDVAQNSPTVVDGVVYANVGAGSNDPGLYALDATSGRQLWVVPLGAQEGVGVPTVVGGVVYVESIESQTLHALSATSGRELWSFHADVRGDIIEPSPTVVNGVVYFGMTGGNNALHALNATSGRVLWSFRTNDDERLLWEFTPTVVKGVVYLSSDDGDLYALNATSGQELWSFQPSGFVTVRDSPTVVNGIVYISTQGETDPIDKTLYALNAASGRVLWSFQTDTSPIVAGDVVYVGSITNADKFYALNAASGRVLWMVRTLGYVLTSPTVVNGVAYFSSLEDSLYAVNATSGQVLWTVQTGGPSQFSPTVVNGVVYINTGDNKLYAFNATSGQKLWSFQAPGLISGPPIVANNIVYDWANSPLPDPNNISYIYAFGLPEAG